MKYSQTEHHIETEKSATFQVSGQKALPTLPHIQTRLLDLCSSEDDNLAEISNLIKKDPALSLKTLSMAGSARLQTRGKVPTIEQAVNHIGKNAINNMAVCAAAESVLGLPGTWTLEEIGFFWKHSLQCAVSAQLIAEEIQCHDPEGAFLAGILHDVGKLILLVNFPIRYKPFFCDSLEHSEQLDSERSSVGTDHSRMASWLVHRYTGHSFMADAIFYHHFAPEKIMTAFPLVQIVYVANLLSKPDPDLTRGHETAGSILDLSRNQIEEVVSRAGLKVEKTVIELGIKEGSSGGRGEKFSAATVVYPPLAERLKDVSLVSGLARNLLQAGDNSEIFQLARQNLKHLFDIDDVYFFLYDSNKDALVGQYTKGDERSIAISYLSIPMRMKSSLPVFSLLRNATANTFTPPDNIETGLADSQFLHFSGREGLLCLPLASDQKGIGVIVIGIDRRQYPCLSRQAKLLQTITLHVSDALFSNQTWQAKMKKQSADASTTVEATTRKVVHEVNTPLGIINNYLKVLEMKLSEHNIVLEELRIIKEEMNRAGRIINSLMIKNNQDPPLEDPADLNAILADISSLLKETLAIRSNIEIHLDLDTSIPKIILDPDSLKQVFLNLITNAAEALGDDGNIYLKTTFIGGSPEGKPDGTKGNFKERVRIVITDDGPGISDELKQSIFEPYVTSKSRHEGLGLSVVNDLLALLNGSIQCESSRNTGTRFTIELPMTQN